MIHGSTEVRDAYRDDSVARNYVNDRFRQPLGALLHDRQVTALKSAIGRYRPQRVLEIAPGPGRLTADVCRFFSGTGILLDASPQMLAEARRRLGKASRWRPVLGDVFDLPLRGEFDMVYTFRLVRHFESAERAAIYRQIHGALRPGGVLIFDAVNERVSAPLRKGAAPGEYAHFDALLRPEVLTEELTSAGFTITSMEGVQHRYPMLQKLQVFVAPRSARLARTAMNAIDRWGGGEPLEWIVTCRK